MMPKPPLPALSDQLDIVKSATTVEGLPASTTRIRVGWAPTHSTVSERGLEPPRA